MGRVVGRGLSVNGGIFNRHCPSNRLGAGRKVKEGKGNIWLIKG